MKCLISDDVLAKRKQFFLQKCKEHGLRCTPQKQKIYEILAYRDDHPSAQEIFEEVKQVFSSLSFATVYKNLSLFASKKMISRLDFGEGVSRFDAEMQHHCHIYDTKNSTVHDVFLNQIPIIPIPPEASQGSVQRIDITYFI